MSTERVVITALILHSSSVLEYYPFYSINMLTKLAASKVIRAHSNGSFVPYYNFLKFSLSEHDRETASEHLKSFVSMNQYRENYSLQQRELTAAHRVISEKPNIFDSFLHIEAENVDDYVIRLLRLRYLTDRGDGVSAKELIRKCGDIADYSSKDYLHRLLCSSIGLMSNVSVHPIIIADKVDGVWWKNKGSIVATDDTTASLNDYVCNTVPIESSLFASSEVDIRNANDGDVLHMNVFHLYEGGSSAYRISNHSTVIGDRILWRVMKDARVETHRSESKTVTVRRDHYHFVKKLSVEDVTVHDRLLERIETIDRIFCRNAESIDELVSAFFKTRHSDIKEQIRE